MYNADLTAPVFSKKPKKIINHSQNVLKISYGNLSASWYHLLSIFVFHRSKKWQNKFQNVFAATARFIIPTCRKEQNVFCLLDVGPLFPPNLQDLILLSVSRQLYTWERIFSVKIMSLYPCIEMLIVQKGQKIYCSRHVPIFKVIFSYNYWLGFLDQGVNGQQSICRRSSNWSCLIFGRTREVLCLAENATK